ncbi:MAG: hypothetical protein ACE5Q6_06410 [Dehalococcoidia bacterium]
MLEFIQSQRHLRTPAGGQFPGHQPDPCQRQQMEQVAVRATAEYYQALGYQVSSVEKHNLRWDLEVRLAGRGSPRLEAKGLTGSMVIIELTPNEYRMSQDFRAWMDQEEGSLSSRRGLAHACG